jgi:predicted RNA-binding protein (virulence factor B family)
MSKFYRNGLAVLIFGLLVTGCSKPGDKLVKQKIACFNEGAEELEKTTDKDSHLRALIAVRVIFEKNVENDKELGLLKESNPDAYKAAMEANKEEFEKAEGRFRAAKAKSSEFMQ